MKMLDIKNFGIIKSAKIDLSGLTVITGNNDTGKSTIGKLFFSIIKARKELEKEATKILQDVVKATEDLYNFLKSHDNINKLPLGIEYFRKDFIKELKRFIETPLLQEVAKEDLNLIFSEREEMLDKFNLYSSLPQNIFEEIKKVISETAPDEGQLAEPLNKYLDEEFSWNITPKQTNLISEIKYVEGNDELVNFKIDTNKISALDYIDGGHFKEATLIETPLILQISKMFDIEKGDIHILDLLEKLKEEPSTDNKYVYKSDRLTNIIRGKFYFDENDKNFYFSKDNSGNFEALNSASGIKSFGLLQILQKNNWLHPYNLIIIDEPENHLHPEWQLKYAEMIIELIKNDISVVLSTHSPYMLQALRHFGKNEKSKIKFYLSEMSNDNDFAEIKDVTKNLNEIFAKLAKPLTDLVWM